MHSYLRAIGFSKVNNDRELLPLLQQTIDSPDIRMNYGDVSGGNLIDIKKEFGNRFGIAVCGSSLDEETFHMEYYYPYFRGVYVSTEESVEFEKHNDKCSYAGICEDVRLGVTLIYYLQNPCDYLAKSPVNKRGKDKKVKCSTMLTGLSIEGKIIMPTCKSTKTKDRFEKLVKRTQLIQAARNGDEEAIETLTVQDIDTFAMVSGRIGKEDMLSIIDTSIMPYGIEGDMYSVIGEIIDIKREKNTLTNEEIYLLTIMAKDIIFDICINSIDLLGEAQIGRRFKGNIWMQGIMTY